MGAASNDNLASADRLAVYLAERENLSVEILYVPEKLSDNLDDEGEWL